MLTHSEDELSHPDEPSKMKKFNFKRQPCKTANLALDLDNPRFGLKKAEGEGEALGLLVERGKLGELWNSITSQGWVDLEPMVCIEKEAEPGKFIVLEGNRRLAAIKILLDPSKLEKKYQSRVPAIVDELRDELDEIEIVVVDERHDADAFIGFKHVNGPASWGSLPKAKFATEMYAGLLDEGVSEQEALTEVTNALGETSDSSMLRMLVGYEVLEQAVKEEYVSTEDVEAKTFDFSHLYTMMPNPATRAFLGWGPQPLSVGMVKKAPVTLEHLENLRLLMGWLFGGEDIPRVIKAQGADRPKLQKVLAHEAATDTLITTGNFESAASKAGLDVDSWRSRLIKAEDQAEAIMADLKVVQARLSDKHVLDAIERSGTLKSTYNTIMSSLRSFNED